MSDDLTSADVREVLDFVKKWKARAGNDIRVGIDSERLEQICRLALAVLEPEWRKEPPTEPGWYWCRHTGGEFTVVVQVTRDAVDGSLLIGWFPKTRQREAAVLVLAENEWCEWSGPIEPPAENAELRGSNG